MEVEWVPTEHAVYAAIYAVHHNDLSVFGTHTCVDGCEFHYGRGYMLTEWGFKDADAPLIRSVCDGDRETGEWSYWIAKVKGEE